MRVPLKLRCLILLVLASCSSTPERHTYTLSPAQGGAPARSVLVAEVRVSAPTYLNFAGIALASGAHEFTYAAHHEWVEPLEEGVQRALRRQLERVGVPEDVERIDVSLERFHGEIDGTVMLEAIWQARRPSSDRQHAAVRFRAVETSLGQGYGHMVEAHHRLLERLAEEIASTLGAS
ncbi:MAG: PqiC family protein [Planctomycetota bacterium]